MVAELDDGRYLLGECKWSSSPVGLGVYYGLRDKVSRLREAQYLDRPTYAIFSLAGFRDDLKQTAAREGVLLISGGDLLS
jgi:hypothetical protein